MTVTTAYTEASLHPRARKFRNVLLLLGMFLILIVNREFGVADNGDFTRYVESFIAKPVELQNNWPNVTDKKIWHYRFFDQPLSYWDAGKNTDSSDAPWFTSAQIFWQGGLVLNNVFFYQKVVNIRYTGMLFFLIQALALAALISVVDLNKRSAALAALLAFLAFTDAQISAFYNSFYAESVPFIGVFVAFAFFLSRMFMDETSARKAKINRYIGLASFLLLCLSVLAKRQYLYFVFPAALVAFYLWVYSRDLSHKKKAIFFAAILIMLTSLMAGITLWSRKGNASEADMTRITAYDSLYYGLLPHSGNPTQLLAELELPADSTRFIGQRAWNEPTRAFINNTPAITPGAFLKAIYLDPRAFLLSTLTNARLVGDFNVGLGMVQGATRKRPHATISSLSHLATQISGLPFLLGALCLATWMILFHPNLPSGRTAPQRALALLLLSVVIADILMSTFDGQQDARKHELAASMACVLIYLQAISMLPAWIKETRARKQLPAVQES
jgi:hypothetical protein